MSTAFLPKSRKSRYARVIIPHALRPFFNGRVEVWRSLRTADKEEALCRSSKWQAEAKRLFRTLKYHGERMTKAQIETLVARWLESELDYAEDCRALAGPMSEAKRDSQIEGLSIMCETANEALLANDYRKIEGDADALIKAAGFPPLEHDSAEFGRLCRRLLRARIEYTKIETDRWNGEYTDDLRNNPTANNVPLAPGPASPQATSKPFTEVVRLYFKENAKAKRTDQQMQAEFERFLKPLGQDIQIHSITKEHCRMYKESILHERNLSQSTCIKHLSSLSCVFKWAEAQGFIPEHSNPVRGLPPNKRQAKKQAAKRRPFTDEELVMVFSSKEFLAQREERPERFWIILLLLFECCRREEAAQLYLNDICEAEGIPYLHITNEEEDQSLKNDPSKRRVPIHSSLIQLGFLHYIESIKQAGHDRLFPQLKNKGNNGYGDPVGKWFGRMKRNLGLTDRRLVLHSFRHGGITKLHSAGVPVNIVETLTGHSAGNVHEQYVHKDLISMKTLKEALEKLHYREVLDLLKLPLTY